MKVLLMCYECSPYIGSEWAVGWGRLLGAAKVAETHVITSERNFADLQRAKSEGLVPANVSFYTPEPDAILRESEKKPGVFAYNYKAYNHWQKLALALIEQLHARHRFDLVHQVNVCTFREPGYGYKLGIPFVWGPVGGSQNFPASFLRALSPKEAVKEGLRGIANRITLRRARVQEAAKAATRLLAANSVNQHDFVQAFGREVELLLETGLHHVQQFSRARYTERISNKLEGRPQGPMRLLWSGEHHTRKALPVLLRALARLDQSVAWQLDVLGDGAMRSQWTDEAKRLGLASRVLFRGQQVFSDAVAEMQSAHLLCFTSLRDTSGNVVLEALGAGVPVICFDHQGVGDIVDSSCGIKVSVTSPGQAYQDWAEAIATLAADPDRLFELSYGATERAETFLWSANHERVNAIYKRLVYGAEAESTTPLPQVDEALAPKLPEVAVL